MDDVFVNRLEVLKHLKQRGFKIGKTKLYEDAQAGRLRVQSDGSVKLSDVELYEKAYLSEKKSGAEDCLARRKMELEVQRLENQVREQDLDYQKSIGKLIEKDDVEMELASRAAVLEAGLKNMIYVNASDWVHLVGGRPEKVLELAERMVEIVDGLLNEYAQVKTFQVLFDVD